MLPTVRTSKSMFDAISYGSHFSSACHCHWNGKFLSDVRVAKHTEQWSSTTQREKTVVVKDKDRNGINDSILNRKANSTDNRKHAIVKHSCMADMSNMCIIKIQTV